MSRSEREQAIGWARWRWRLRGATMWPTFWLCAVADVLLLRQLPPIGDSESLTDAFVVGGALNLVIVAAAAPLAGVALRRWRRDLPVVVARDYAGSALLICGAVGLAGLGILNRPHLMAVQHAFAAQSQAMREYVEVHAPAPYRRHLDRADSVRLGPDMYRTCVPGDDPQRALCLFIDTSRSPPRVRVDSDRAPNPRYFNEPGADFAGG